MEKKKFDFTVNDAVVVTVKVDKGDLNLYFNDDVVLWIDQYGKVHNVHGSGLSGILP